MHLELAVPANRSLKALGQGAGVQSRLWMLAGGR